MDKLEGKSHLGGSLRYLPAVIVGMSAFIAVFDVTAVALLLRSIESAFAVSSASTIWVMSAYSLTFTTMVITAGAISDRYGYRLTLMSGAIVMLLASMVCVLAPSYAWLVAGRVAQGVGAACISCGGYALVGRIYTQKADRVRAFALIGTLGGSALIIGPPVGGIIAAFLGWKWVFLTNIPICGAILIAVLWAIKEQREPSVRRLDAPGIAAFSSLLFMAAWFFLQGPRIEGFVVGAPLWTLIMAVLLAVFVFVELRTPRPAIDIGLFGRADFVGLALVPLSLAISYWSLIIFIPSFLTESLSFSAWTVPYVVLFFTIPMFVVPYWVKGVALRAKPSHFFGGGLLTVSGGCAAMAVGALIASDAVSIAGMVVGGSGAAAIQAQVSGALIAKAPAERAGSIAAITTVLRQGGFAVGTAFLGNIMQAGTILDLQPNDRFAVLFTTCAVISLAGALGVLLLMRRNQEEDIVLKA